MLAPLRRWAWDFCVQKKVAAGREFIPPAICTQRKPLNFAGVLHSCQHFLEICLIVNIP